MKRILYRVKCHFGYHYWGKWNESTLNHYVFHREKGMDRICLSCHLGESCPLPRLSERLELALETRDRVHIEKCLNGYERTYGVQAFNKGMTEIALKKIKVKTHDAKYVINRRLIEYYLTSIPLTSAQEVLC